MKAARSRLLVLLLALVFAAYVVYPLGILAVTSFHSGGAVSLAHYRILFDLTNTGNLEAVGNSVIVSILSVVFSGVTGILLAFVFTQCDVPSKRVLSRLAVLPVALPPLVGVLAFLFVFGETGILPRALRIVAGSASAPLAVKGLTGVVLVHVYSFHVYFYLFCSAALRTIDASRLDAAAGMGSGSWRTFRTVVLPELRPAIIGASALTFMASMSSFTAPLLFAGDRRFLTLQIYQTKLNGDLDLAAAQSVLLTCVAVAFYAFVTVKSPLKNVTSGGKGTGRPGILQIPAAARITLTTVVLVFLVIELLPVAVIVLLSFAREGSWTTQLIPAAYGIDNYVAMFRDAKHVEPILNSIILSVLTCAAAVLFGLPAAVLATKGKRRGLGRAAQIVLTVPYAVPGTVVAIALILAFNVPGIATAGQVLVGTFWILPLAYFVREYPLVLRSTVASLETLDDTLLEAADGLGAGSWRKFRMLTLPAILPGVVTGGVLVVIAALGEFVSSVLLYTYASRPISVEVLAQLRLFNIGTAACYSVILMVLILTLLRVAELPGRGSRPKGEAAVAVADPA